MVDDTSAKKVLASCIYCQNPPDGNEHWLNRGFGTFQGNTYLTGRICTACNVYFGGTIDLELLRSGHTGVQRQLLGIAGRRNHDPRNVFDYKSSEPEPPVQILRPGASGLMPVLEQGIGRNPDGTLLGMQRRVLTVATVNGNVELPFPKGWGEHQLRALAAERGVLDGRPVAMHVPPPETLEQFKESSSAIIRAVFGPFDLNASTTRPDGEVGPIEPTIIRFTLGPAYPRGIAKVAFHYFLWACPQVGGDEPEFSAIRAYIRNAIGEPDTFVFHSESFVERPSDGRPGHDCHAFSTLSVGTDLVATVILFSQPVGPQLPAYAVHLGRRPAALPATWQRNTSLCTCPVSMGTTASYAS
jgi:hypothetical protein